MYYLISILLFLIFWYALIQGSNIGKSLSYLEAKCKSNEAQVSFLNFCFLIIADKGLLALLIYRVSNRVDSKVLGKLFTRLGEFLTGVEIYYNANIGYSVNIWHGNGVVIGQSAVVGDFCIILQQVTLGGGFVRLGSNCKVGAGAKILGNISLGNNVVVGANAVVTSDVKSNVLVVGVPARPVADINDSSDIKFGTKEEG